MNDAGMTSQELIIKYLSQEIPGKHTDSRIAALCKSHDPAKRFELLNLGHIGLRQSRHPLLVDGHALIDPKLSSLAENNHDSQAPHDD